MSLRPAPELADLFEWVGAVASALTILFLLAGFVIVRPWWIRTSLAWARRRCISGGISLHAHVQRVRDLSHRTGDTPAGEADWLACQLGDRPDRTLTAAVRDTETLAKLADGYERLAARLDGRILLGTSIGAVSHQRDHAQATSEHLRDLASRGEVLSPGADVDWGRVQECDTHWEWLAHPGMVRDHVAFDLGVSYRRHLTYVAYPSSPWLRAVGMPKAPVDLEPADLDAIEDRMAGRVGSAHVFDGLLPRLTSISVGRDASSGRLRLNLDLAACAYSSVVADHYGSSPFAGEADVRGRRVGALTLSCIPLTRDGYLVLAQRSAQADSHRGRMAPGVNGNLELSARRGVGVDLDEYGLPDLTRALAREAREELGLRIDPAAITTIGLTRFWCATEGGTYNLLSIVRLPINLEDVSHSYGESDLIEGRWEIGEEFVGVRLPRASDGPQRLREQVRWFLEDPSMSPHASASGVAALAAWTGRSDLVRDELVSSKAVDTESLSTDRDRSCRGNTDPEWVTRVSADV